MSTVEIPTRASLGGVLFDDLTRIRRLESLPAVYTQEIKVVSDTGIVSTGDGKFKFAIAEDLDGLRFLECHAFITTLSSSGLVTVQISNRTDAVDVLSTPITIDVGEYDSYTAATQPVVNPSNRNVARSDRIWVDVDGAGTGAMGLGVILTYTVPPPA